MKKNVSALLLSVLIMVSLVGPTAAIELHPSGNSTSISETAGKITPRAEETRWYFREINGRKQMRLWSITEGKWLTDWIDVE